MKWKYDVATLLPKFKLLVENFFQTLLVSIFIDNGSEYQGFAQFLHAHDLSHFTTAPHTHG